MAKELEGVKAECTWGDGPDVLLVVEGKPLMAYHDPVRLDEAKHGYIEKGSMCLTTDEAFQLGMQLVRAGIQAEQLELGYEEHLKRGGDTKMQTLRVQIPKED